MITSLTWIPRGAARTRPVRFEISQEEYARVKSLASAEEAQLQAEIEGGGIKLGGGGEDSGDLPDSLRMDEYDEDEDDNAGLVTGDIDDDDDLAIVEHGVSALAIDADSDGEDAEDDEIRPTDSLIVTAITEDDYSHLEIQLITDDGTMYVHHDITLPEFPLCLAWMDCPPFLADGGQMAIGNYIAVGTFNPEIEIWNLDVLDPLEPTATLGGAAPGMIKPKKKGKKGQEPEVELLEGSHEGAVMSLSWNRSYRQALASGSADCTVKIWDVTTQACSHTFTHHTDKVQAVLWHPTEAWALATGSFDKSIALLDCRSGALGARYALPSDVEALAWDPFCVFNLYCTLEDGQVACFDIRNSAAPQFVFAAHKKTTSSIGFSTQVPGMLATASLDKTVKVWDVSGAHGGAVVAGYEPPMVAYKSMNVGKLFALEFSSDDPFTLACAGDKGMLAVWESDENETIVGHFGPRVSAEASGSVYTALASMGSIGGVGAAIGGDGALTAPLVGGSGLGFPGLVMGGVVGVASVVGVSGVGGQAESGAGMEGDDEAWMDEPDEPLSQSTDKKKKKKKDKKKKA